jgi:hypothetical protein
MFEYLLESHKFAKSQLGSNHRKQPLAHIKIKPHEKEICLFFTSDENQAG